MKIFVLDSSAIIRLYISDGPLPDKLEDHIFSAWKGEAIIMAPELALAEIAQVLLKKELSGHITRPESETILEAILELPLEIVGHRELLNRAIHVARQLGLTVYDALFFVLADSKKAALITADQELEKAYLRHSTNKEK